MKFNLDAIFNVDRRIVFIFVFLALLIPLLVPYAMPCKPTRDVNDMFRLFDEAAANDRPVFLSFEFDPTGAAEQEPMARAVMRHIFARGGKAVVMCKSGGQQGEDMHLRILRECAQEYGASYGADYVYLPYKPGSTNIVINLGQSLYTAWPQDKYGTNLSEIPVTRNVSRLADFDYVMVICSSLTTVVDWLTYGQAPYNLKMGFGVLGNVTPDCSNYVNSGQIKGLLGGLIGAAQYEQIISDEGIGLLRLFSPADLVSSELPGLCAKLAGQDRSGIAKFMWDRLSPADQVEVKKCAARGRDILGEETRDALVAALNEAIRGAGAIPDAELANPNPDDKIGGLLERGDFAAHLPQIRRRLHIENELAGAVARCHGDGRAMRWMTPQSYAHLVLIIAILFGNVCYFWERARRKKQQTKA